MNVIVNGRQVVTPPVITYEQLIELAASRPGATVTYKCSDDQGSLVEGEGIEVEEGMIFNVAVTDSA
jgi:hypothetical protein